MEIKGSTIAGILVRVCLYSAVAATVLFFEIDKRPKKTDLYYTNVPSETTRGGAAYTCGCSLPASLQDAKNVDTKNDNLNICYESSRLETVTVLMYSNSAAILVPELEREIKELASYDVIKRTVEGREGGYRVNQEAHDLTGYIARNPPSSTIKDLFLNGRRETEIHPSVEYLRRPVDFITFPKSYLRLAMNFRCNNCSICSLKEVKDMANDVVKNGSNKDAAWANCFYWGGDDKCNTTEHWFEARCLFYPTEALPPNFAIRRFFDTFMTQSPLSRGVSILAPSQEFENDGPHDADNWTALQPSSLYLNVSQVENSTNPIRYGFVEVLKGSALWASLWNLFPTLGNCSAMQNVSVCSGTSVCNVFTNADAYDLRCQDMNDTEQCKTLMGFGDYPTGPHSDFSTFDNALNLWPANSSARDRDIWENLQCPEFKCLNAPPYTLIWNTSENMQKDALNRFLSSRILNDYWGQSSGVCTNTYEDVLRFPLTTAAASGLQVQAKLNLSDHMLLQSDCMDSRYCWLTGYYRNINDTPGEDWKEMPHDLFPPPKDRFVCYRVLEEGFGSRFITIWGVLFGWLGSVELFLKWFVIPIVLKFHKFMHGRKLARIQRKLLAENCTPQGSYGKL